MAKTSKGSPGKGRSAETGRYVPKSYVATHKRTTVVERDRGGKGSKKKG